MSSLPPTGLITLLFADVESSGLGLQRHGDAYRDALRRLQEIAHAVADLHSGYYASHTGDGFFLVFASTFDAVRAACQIQTLLLGTNRDPDIPVLRVRIGVDTGIAEIYRDQYEGAAVWRTHRVMSAGHGTQVILSGDVHSSIQNALAELPGVRCEELGSYRLRDILTPTSLVRLWIEGIEQSDRAPRALSTSKHNLDQDDRRFIGRLRERESIRRLFQELDARLVTLVGIGGIGKTRLAAHAAAELVDAFPDGVWLVELAFLRTREEAAAAICHALQIPDLPTEAALQQFLAPKRLLLLLDSFENLPDSGELVQGILDAAPGVSCLVTSRKAVGLPGEHVYAMQPMQTIIANPSLLPDAASVTPSRSDSAALFVEAARHVDVEFTVNSENESLIEELTALLEGIPLSIILAAGWLNYLSLAELIEPIRKGRLELLAGESDSVVRTRLGDLRRVIDESFLLLPEESQRLMRKLQVFVGGFTIEGAQEIAGEAERIPVLHKIARLVEHGFVQRQVQGSRTWYRLLDTVREYLAVTTTEGAGADLAECRERHAQRCVRIAGEMGVRMAEHEWAGSTAVFWREFGNFQAAIAFAMERGDDRRILDLADALDRIYFEAGLWSDFEVLARAAEEAALRVGQTRTLQRLIGLRAAHALRQGRLEEAEELWEKRLVLCREMGDAALCVDCLCDLAQIAQEKGRWQSAQESLDEAIDLARKQGTPAVMAHKQQAEVKLALGDLVEALEHAMIAQASLSPQAGLDETLHVELTLGRVLREVGDAAGSERALGNMLRLAREGSREFGVSRALLELGALYEREGRWKPAALAYVAAEKIHANLPAQRREVARSELSRLCEKYASAALDRVVDESRKRPWRDLVAELLGE